MKNSNAPYTGPHDLGGSPAASVDQSDHDITFWEQRIDAMVNLLAKNGVITDWAQLRRGIESLSPEAYNTLNYYERWAAAAAEIVIEQGLIKRDELDQHIKALQSPKNSKP